MKPEIDINEMLQNNKTRGFTMIVVSTVLLLIIGVFILVSVETCHGKHVKTPVLETNIPGPERDTIAIIITDSSGMMKIRKG